MSTDALTHLGRTEWLAQSHDEYLAIATSLASDIEQLDSLRLRLRHEVEQSPLMRDDIVCSQFGNALRTMWLRWQAKIDYPDDPSAQQNAIAQWQTMRPAYLDGPPRIRVGLKTGENLSLAEAHQRLQQLVGRALSSAPTGDRSSSPVPMSANWVAVTELAELILSAVPNDAVSLTCLAEVEHANGHTEFAMTYLRYATLAMQTSPP